MTTQTRDHRGHGFILGLVAGTLVGTGLAAWLVPRTASKVRRHVVELTRKGEHLRDDVADAVAHGAHEVERYATALKTNHTAPLPPSDMRADLAAGVERHRAPDQ